MALFVAAVDSGGVTVFLRATCGTELTPRLTGAPYVAQEDQGNPVPCQPRGFFKVGDGGFVISAGARDTVVVHPDDAPALQPLPGWANGFGCCGPTGVDGLNRACACGASVATLAADCYGPYELHLDPQRW